MRIVDGQIATSATHILIARKMSQWFKTSRMLCRHTHKVHIAVCRNDVANTHLVPHPQWLVWIEVFPLGAPCLLNVEFSFNLQFVRCIEFQAALPGGLQKVVDETLPALFELRDKGVVGHVGITDLQLENLKWVVERCDGVESILNFCHYTLNDDALTDYLDFFEQHGVGIINASPLSMGLLSQRGVPAWHPAPKALVEACQKAAEHCKAKGYPIEKLAVQYSVSNPRIASTLFSSANPDNVRRNILWANEEPDWDLVKEVKDIIGDQQRVTWANS